MTATLLVRADAGPGIGLGHVMRCLTLCRRWIERGGRARLLGRWAETGLGERIEAHGVEVRAMGDESPTTGDLDTTLAGLEELRVAGEDPILVLDGYRFTEADHEAVRRAGHRLVVIDDHGHLPRYQADVILNQSLESDAIAYRCPEKTLQLIGRRYILLRPEVLEAKRPVRRDERPAVLVTLGGGDSGDLLVRVVTALARVGAAGMRVDVAVGPGRFEVPALEDVLPDSATLTVHRTVDGLPGLMAAADVAVTAGGSTCWELAYLGVPAVVVVRADNQAGIARGLETAGAALDAGRPGSGLEERLTARLTRLLADDEAREVMARRGRDLVDGRGADRVCEVLATLARKET